MDILIDAASARQGGGQTYLINLIARIPMAERLRVGIVLPEGFALPESCAGVEPVVPRWPVTNPFVRAAWQRLELPRLLRQRGVKVLFTPGGVTSCRPPAGCVSVTMFRNMIPFDREQRARYPLGYQRVRNWLLRRAMLGTMKDADRVIFISEWARSVIEDALGHGLPQGVVIPHGVNDAFRAGLEPLPRPASVPEGAYLLYVSTIDYYKAQLEVVQGYAAYRERTGSEEKLLLVGPRNPSYAERVVAEIERLGLQDEVLMLGNLPYADLPAVYQHARVNIFASESENCPNILLECLASARPVVCSDRPPMAEFGGEAVRYFNPRAPASLADALADLRNSPDEAVRLAGLAAERARKYDWSDSAMRTWQELRALAAG